MVVVGVVESSTCLPCSLNSCMFEMYIMYICEEFLLVRYIQGLEQSILLFCVKNRPKILVPLIKQESLKGPLNIRPKKCILFH